jgi:drug/metabolite transporter (DMT)-like permease
MWMLFALLSPAVYTITNYVDKFLLSKRVKDYNALPIYTASVSFIFGFVWWAIVGFPLLPPFDAGIIILTGMITIFSIVLYFQALSTEETSTVILLFQLSPLFTLLLSSIFLKEVISNQQYIGFGFILGATLLLALPKKNDSWKLPKSFWLIMIYDILFAIIGILLKFATYESSFSQIVAYESIGMGIGGVLIFLLIPQIRKAFLKSRKQLFKKALPVIVLNEIFFIIAKSLGYYAFVIGPVALVSVLTNVQVFFGIVFGWMITRLFPKLLKEDISSTTFNTKLIMALLLFIGLYFLI